MSCAAAVTQVASAADLPTKAPITSPSPLAYNWTGFYIGINAGGHWGRDKINATADQLAFFGGQLESLSSATLSSSGFIGGIQAGYNWQINNVVFGIEGDGDWLTGKQSRAVIFPGPSPAPGDVLTNSVENRFLGTVRGRLGLAFDRTLLYVTGGVAFGSLRTKESMCILTCPGTTGATFTAAQTTTTHTGWTSAAVSNTA